MNNLKIKKIELTLFEIELSNIIEDRGGIGIKYSPGQKGKHIRFGIKIFDNLGNVGEYIPPRGRAKVIMSATEALSYYILDQNPFFRDNIYRQLRGLTKHIGEVGIGAIDVAIYDLICKYLNISISDFLGGKTKKIIAYASTMSGDREKNGLSSPEAYADFAEECYELGYKAFKMHGWTNGDVGEESNMIKAVAKRVGGRMKIMYDAACHLKTLTDALEVGKVCDDHDLYWYEDPYKDGGVSINGNRVLSEKLSTPILVGEHMRNFETSTDMIVNGASFFSRADPDYDGGITGSYKLATASEGLGIDCEIHSCGPAMRHLISAVRNSNFYEVNLVHPNCKNAWSLPIYLDGYSDEIDCIDQNGNVSVSDKPGLGVSYDWNYIKKHTLEKLIID
jgi:L-alanine-DL-glutamate epimerase-like enolase superfamily enzyme